MEVAAERINAWFDFAAREGFEECHWKVAAKLPEATLSHRSGGLLCGHLIRFDMTNIFVEGAPENPRNLLVRPEVRGQYDQSLAEMQLRWRTTLAPGDSMVERTSKLWVLRMASLLFGNSSGPFRNSFFYDTVPVSARHQLRRDFPLTGDCAYACFQDYDGVGQEGMLLCRNMGHRNRFRVSMIFSTPEDKWPHWASPLFSFLTDMVRKAIVRFLNRPGIQQMRQMDEEFYLVLCMRSFNRGPPLVPDTRDTDNEADAPLITICAGKHLGLTKWSRLSRGKFRMVEYMRHFLDALGHDDVHIYDSLEGRTLVQYQCVVLRSQWAQVRDSFRQAFHLQKAAYRHANGGTTAPSIVEDARPNLLGCEVNATSSGGSDSATESDPLPTEVARKLVVRNTFLELDEAVNPCPTAMRRSKSESGDLSTFSV